MSDKNSRIAIASMSLQEQVALALLVPESGTDWLDALILKRLRVDFEKLQYERVCTLPEQLVLGYEAFIDEALNGGENAAEPE